jgi:hypothetical protein
MASIVPVNGTTPVPVDNCRIYEVPRKPSATEVDSATFWVSSQRSSQIEIGRRYLLTLDDGTTRDLEVRKAVSPTVMPGSTMFFGVLHRS